MTWYPTDRYGFARVPLNEVRTAVAAYMNSHGRDELASIQDQLARTVFGLEGYPGQRFCNQVYRALNELVESGELRKVGRGEFHPGGAGPENSAYYYTQVRWEQAVALAEEYAAAKQDRNRRWDQVSHYLATRGYAPMNGHKVTHTKDQPDVVISLEDWERIMGNGLTRALTAERSDG